MFKMQDTTDSVFQMRFPQKLWYLLNLRTDAILWGGTGRTILLNYRILYSYLQCDNSIFKTTNISSFIRQLNLYGFRKVTSHLQDPLCNSSNPFMHEYVHDFFQYGRPELLKKITRKALTLKRAFKTKKCFTNDQNLYTPLQRARHALRIALNKVVEHHFVNDSAETQYNMECDDSVNEPCEDNDIEFEAFLSKANTETYDKTDVNDDKEKIEKVSSDNIRYMAHGDMSNFYDNESQQNSRVQLLSMPDLDTISNHESAGAELLAEFNISTSTSSCEEPMKRDDKIDNSLNCVLPSVSSYHMDDITKTDEEHYHGDWDQMFNDIITNKNSQQDSSNLKELLYSQITLTTDLLNS